MSNSNNKPEKQQLDKILELNVTGAGEHYYLIEKLNEVIEVVNKLLKDK